MALKVLPCTKADLLRIVQVEQAAWADDPFTPILFPGPFPEEILEFRIQEMAREIDEDPTVRWLKVIDTEQSNDNEGIAFAKWHVYRDGTPTPTLGRLFGEGCNVEACKLVFGGLAEKRDRILDQKSCVCEYSQFHRALPTFQLSSF